MAHGATRICTNRSGTGMRELTAATVPGAAA